MNDWLNESMFEYSTHTMKDLFLWDYKALLKCLTVLSVKMMPNLSLAWDEENSEKQTNENALNKKHKSQKWDMQPLNPKL